MGNESRALNEDPVQSMIDKITNKWTHGRVQDEAR